MSESMDTLGIDGEYMRPVLQSHLVLPGSFQPLTEAKHAWSLPLQAN